MRNKYIIAVFLAIMTAVSLFTMNAAAISWDGSSTGGGGGGSAAGANGYAVRSTDNDTACIGYRFSVVDKSGSSKGRVIDVFRNTSGGNAAHDNNHAFNTKRNKKQLIDNQNGSYSTSKTSTNYYKEANMGFSTALPAPSGIETWKNRTTNLNAVLSAVNVGNIDSLKNGDKILVEPLWDVRLQSVYHSLTVTELAIYGKHILGSSSDGGSSTTPESWGFISQYTNRHWPNALYTPDGQGLWNGVSAIGSSSRETFNNLINRGYGAAIAYTETKPDFTPVLAVDYCLAVKGGASSTTVFGKSTGNNFSNWTYQTAYPIMGDVISFQVKFKPETETVRVKRSMRVDGGSWSTSTSNMTSTESTQWQKVQFSTGTIPSGKSYYTIDAKIDYVDASDKVLKTGTVKTFYIPVRPKINRYQVTYIDVAGNTAARNGTAGSSGSVYVGQKVYPRYTYSSSSTWTSSNNFSNRINSTSSSTGTRDLNISSTNINANSMLVRDSSQNPYVVPNVTSIPHFMTTSWSSDSSRTTENTTINISAVRADIELVEIRLIDGTTGNYVTGNRLWVHQKVTPQYVYKNNTSVRVFVEGYDNDRTRIGGGSSVYTINPNSQINVNGKQITIGNTTSQSFWGGVFLDGAGINNTSWESNGTNNTKTSTYNVEHPLRIQAVTPNSNYRENTEVITSFTVQNLAHFPFTPSYNIAVRFTALNGSASLHTATKSSVVIPANSSNLVWFRWTVPGGLNGSTLTLKGDIIDFGSVAVGTNSMTRTSERRPTSQTPDTQFEKKAPSGFSVTAIPTRTGQTSAQWQEWVYEGGAFVRRTYGLQLNASAPSIVPDVNAPSRSQSGGVWRMSSGYGFTLAWATPTQTLSGTTAPPTASYTAVQAASLYFPEFRYATTVNSFRVLDRNGTNNFRFPANSSAKDNARLHFTPLYYPNGNYQTQGYIYDAWTPAGMLSGWYNSNVMTISGSSYDDWAVQHRN